MTNVYINSLQLNTGNIKCNIESIKIKKQYNNAIYPQYGATRPTVFPVSGGTETYEFTITLWGRGIQFSELVSKEAAIRKELDSQVLTFNPVQFYTDTTPVYFNNLAVNLLFDSSDFEHKATDGTSFITLSFKAQVISVGTIPVSININNGLASVQVASSMVARP